MRPSALLAAAALLVAPAALRAQSTTTTPEPAPADTAVIGPTACRTPAQAATARELLVLTRTERQITQGADAMLDTQLRNSPFMAQHFGDLLRDFFREQMQWKYFEPQFTRLYCELYTDQELRDLVAFQKTPLGQKMIETTPVLMQRGMQMGEARMKAAMPELQKRIEARMQQLKAEGKVP